MATPVLFFFIGLQGDTDVCFGNVVSGRSNLSHELDQLVIPTFNTIPFRIDVRNFSNGSNVLKAAQRLNATSTEHQYCPLRLINARLGFTETGVFSSLLLLQASQLDVDSSIWSVKHENGAMDVSTAQLRIDTADHESFL